MRAVARGREKEVGLRRSEGESLERGAHGIHVHVHVHVHVLMGGVPHASPWCLLGAAR